MPTLPTGGIPPPSPVPRATRPFLFGEGITQITTGGGATGPQGPAGPAGPPGAQGPGALTGVFNVQTYGAAVNGTTDDTAAIMRTITAAQGNGILYIPGVAKISSTLTISGPLTIWGDGTGMDWNNVADAIWAPLSGLSWAGGASPMISITGPTGPISFQGLALDCGGTATTGILADQWQAGVNTDLAIRRSTGYALDLKTTSSTANANTMGLVFSGLYLRGNGLLRMAGNAGHTANCCHNTFNGLIGSFSGTDAIHLSDADNNRFTGVFLFSEAGLGSNYGVYFDTYARGNYFYGLEPGLNGTFSALPNTATWANTIIGYDRNNGQAAPTITSNPGHNSLVWTEDGANSTGWNNLTLVNPAFKNISGGSSTQAVRFQDTNTGKSMYVRGFNASGGLGFLNNAFTTVIASIGDDGTLSTAGPMVGPVLVLTTTFTASAYTLALGDADSAQQASNGASTAIITVPTNASVAFPTGTVVTVTQTGSGKIQIAAAGGVTIISSVSGGFVSGTTGCRTQNSTIGLLKTGTNTWVMSGDVA